MGSVFSVITTLRVEAPEKRRLRQFFEDSEKDKVYPALLPSNGAPMLLAKIRHCTVIKYEREDICKDGAQVKKKKILTKLDVMRNEKAKLRKRLSRKKIVGVNGVRKTNRKLESERQKQARLARKQITRKVSCVSLPPIRATTDYTSPSQVVQPILLLQRGPSLYMTRLVMLKLRRRSWDYCKSLQRLNPAKTA